MDSTTIKLSIQTRDRLKAFGGDTYEDTVTRALDALEAQQFWAQVDAAAAARSRATSTATASRLRATAEVDAAFAGID